MKFTQADWEQHVANNHVPYRRDCAVCVHGAGNGRRHHGVVHPDVYCMSADIAGPIPVKGKDPESRNHRPATFKYFLAVSYRFPRLKGVKEESDPSQTEGFDDAALLPGGTDDLADGAFPAAEGPPHEDYEDSLYEPSLAEEEDEAEGEGVEGPREFAAKVAEEHPWESARCELETPPDMARVRGKRSAGVRLDDVFALDPPPPLPPPAEAPHPEGPVSPVEEESARVARLSLQDLEGLATELIEDDWDLDEALWVLAEVCRAAPQLQHKAGLYRHGGTVELEVSWNLKHSPDQRRTQSEHALLACQPDTETQVEEEEGLSEDSLPEQPVLWELWVPHPQTGEQLCVLRSDDSDASEACALCKSEPVYTTNVELLLDGLQEPLQVVHTVDPRDAEQCIERWMPSIHKEIGVIEMAVRRLPPAEVRSGGWLKRKEVKVVPSKFVFTVKPPDPAEASLATRKGQAYHKRKARLVACGNHAYSETQAVGTGTVAQQDLQLSAFAVLLAFFQVVGAASQTTDEEEDLSLPVSLDADLMLAVSIICIGICFIAVWEFFKWCLQGIISRREAGTPVLSLSPRKARKLQRLRDQTAQAIQAEISAREEAASSQSVAAAPRRRPSQTTRTREQAGGAPTRYFATPDGTKLHRTKACSTLAHSHRFVEFQVCQQCHGSAADHTQHSTG
ncbi:GIP [Symbiodinium sp. CCMP2592]|nr:GIP [Symbiodinium sp. CCMP2592]